MIKDIFGFRDSAVSFDLQLRDQRGNIIEIDEGEETPTSIKVAITPKIGAAGYEPDDLIITIIDSNNSIINVEFMLDEGFTEYFTGVYQVSVDDVINSWGRIYTNPSLFTEDQ